MQFTLLVFEDLKGGQGGTDAGRQQEDPAEGASYGTWQHVQADSDTEALIRSASGRHLARAAREGLGQDALHGLTPSPSPPPPCTTPTPPSYPTCHPTSLLASKKGGMSTGEGGGSMSTRRPLQHLVPPSHPSNWVLGCVWGIDTQRSRVCCKDAMAQAELYPDSPHPPSSHPTPSLGLREVQHPPIDTRTSLTRCVMSHRTSSCTLSIQYSDVYTIQYNDVL